MLAYIRSNIQSQKDSDFLGSAIFDLLIHLNKYSTSNLDVLDELNGIANTLKNMKPTKLNKINVDTANDVVRTIEKYKTSFLKESHEKSGQ